MRGSLTKLLLYYEVLSGMGEGEGREGEGSLTKLLRNKHIYHHSKTIEKITISPEEG